MQTYYITDSTIFGKAEEVMAALKNGNEVRNDDADLVFKVKKHYGKDRLFVKEYFKNTGWVKIDVQFRGADEVVKAMDRLVESLRYEYIY